MSFGISKLTTLHIIALSFQAKKVPCYLQKVFLFIEYIQLLALTIILSDQFAEEGSSRYPSVLLSMSKLFCPGYLIQFDENNVQKIYIWFFVVCAFFAVKCIFVVYTFFKAIKRAKFRAIFKNFWSWIFL